MARILIATVPIIGHIHPMLPLARGLAEHGHQVRWCTSDAFQSQVEATGAQFVASRAGTYFANFRRETYAPDGKKLEGAAALKVDIKHLFIEGGLRQLSDLREVAAARPADVVLIDPACIGGLFYAELTRTPIAVLNLLPIGFNSRDTAPNGLGLPPDSSPQGRMRNQMLNWSIEHVLFHDVQQYWNKTRATLGLPPTGWLMDKARDVDLFLQPSVPGFEYPRSDLPPQVHFIGLLQSPPHAWAPPAWWGDLDTSRPVVHVTQGTVANQEPLLIRPALQGLAGEDMLVVVSTGNQPLEALGLGELPPNARIAPFLSYAELLPRTAVMVTNGGYGGVQQALAHGVPLVVAGTTEDKPEVAARVAYSGVGINLKTAAPAPEQVQAAVRRLLYDTRYRQRAQALQAEYARYDAVARGVELVEQLVATRAPVLRDDTLRPGMLAAGTGG